MLSVRSFAHRPAVRREEFCSRRPPFLLIDDDSRNCATENEAAVSGTFDFRGLSQQVDAVLH